jgi:uncharacterized protein YjeT (DUF2065 family)
MESSIFLAQLIGPIFVVAGVGMLAQPQGYRAVAEDFLASPALIYIAGLLKFVPGLAIVLTHNVWTFDWRLIITLLGWLATVGGIFRLLMPAQVRRIGTAMLARRGWLRGSGVAVVALGAVLSFFGYLT